MIESEQKPTVILLGIETVEVRDPGYPDQSRDFIVRGSDFGEDISSSLFTDIDMREMKIDGIFSILFNSDGETFEAINNYEIAEGLVLRALDDLVTVRKTFRDMRAKSKARQQEPTVVQ